MSVIITNMDMPESCARCDLCDSGGYCRALQKETDRNYKDRYSRCPLKSADDMKAEISNLDAPKTDTEYQDGFYDCEQMGLDIIDKYCKGDTCDQ